MIERLETAQVSKEKVRQLLSYCADPKQVITEKFVNLMFELACEIEKERAEQAIEPYKDEDFRILFHAALTAATLHAGKKRLSGKDVFEEHLFGSVMNLVKVQGRTRLPVLAASLLHDTKEDCGIIFFKDFFNSWNNTFISPENPLRTSEISKKVLRRVWSLMGAATKVEDAKSDRVERDAATIRKHLGAIKNSGLDVLHLKASGDRLSNMQTIDHQKEHRKKPIAAETYDVYCRLGEIVAIQGFLREAVSLCARILNPQLLYDFVEIRDRRIFERINRNVETGGRTVSVEEYIRNLTNPDGKTAEELPLLDQIKEIRFIPDELSDFALKKEESLEELTLGDLRISSINPLFEIVAIVKPGTDHLAIVRLIEKYCLRPGDKKKSPDSQDPKDLPYKGTTLNIFSSALGRLRFRINDSVSEARLRRGALPIQKGNPIESDPMPQHMVAAIDTIMRMTKDNVLMTLPLAKELLLRPTIVVYTPAMHSRTLPKGATALDFIASVHTAILGQFSKVVSHSGDEWEEINPLDELENEMILEIVAEEKQSAEIDPGWLLFCRTENAKNALRKKLSKRPRDAVIQSGMDYATKIANLFGVRKTDILKAVADQSKDHSDINSEAIYKNIGDGSVEVLGVLAKSAFADRKIWPIRVALENKPGILAAFLSEFRNQGINAEGVLHIPDRSGKPHIVRMRIRDFSGNKSSFDMMRTILKLSYGYNLGVIDSSAIRRGIVRVVDAFRLVWRTLNRPIGF